MNLSSAELMDKYWHRRKRGPVSDMLRHKILDYDLERKLSRAEFYARDEFRNPMGNVQGGFLAAMLDEAVTDVILFDTGFDFYIPTLTLQLQFLRPAVGERFVSEASVVRRGRTTAFLQATLFDENVKAVAVAQSTTQLVPAKEASAQRREARGNRANIASSTE